MPTSSAAIALINTTVEGQSAWLGRWNGEKASYTFVAGVKEDAETFRECLGRAVAECLGVEPTADFVVAEKPTSCLQYVDLSDDASMETTHGLELYRVELVGDFAEDKIQSDSENRWLSPDEIRAGLTQDGKTISPTMSLYLQMAGLLK